MLALTLLNSDCTILLLWLLPRFPPPLPNLHLLLRILILSSRPLLPQIFRFAPTEVRLRQQVRVQQRQQLQHQVPQRILHLRPSHLLQRMAHLETLSRLGLWEEQ
jgi:hypothetical protein